VPDGASRSEAALRSNLGRNGYDLSLVTTGGGPGLTPGRNSSLQEMTQAGDRAREIPWDRGRRWAQARGELAAGRLPSAILFALRGPGFTPAVTLIRETCPVSPEGVRTGWPLSGPRASGKTRISPESTGATTGPGPGLRCIKRLP